MAVLSRLLNGLVPATVLFTLFGAVNSAFAVPPPPVSGAPGPIAGAGLPFLAIGYGAYWVARRLRRKSN
jgi:hypothetical protein